MLARLRGSYEPRLYRLSDVIEYRKRIRRPLRWLCHSYEDLASGMLEAVCEELGTKWCVVFAIDYWIGCVPLIGHVYYMALGLWIKRGVFGE